MQHIRVEELHSHENVSVFVLRAFLDLFHLPCRNRTVVAPQPALSVVTLNARKFQDRSPNKGIKKIVHSHVVHPLLYIQIRSRGRETSIC